VVLEIMELKGVKVLMDTTETGSSTIEVTGEN
jgi:hypothetical protein